MKLLQVVVLAGSIFGFTSTAHADIIDFVTMANGATGESAWNTLSVDLFASTAQVDRRDPKGLFRKARRGELENFTAVDSPYEPPEQPEVRVDTAQMTPEQTVAAILADFQAPWCHRSRVVSPERLRF